MPEFEQEYTDEFDGGEGWYSPVISERFSLRFQNDYAEVEQAVERACDLHARLYRDNDLPGKEAWGGDIKSVHSGGVDVTYTEYLGGGCYGDTLTHTVPWEALYPETGRQFITDLVNDEAENARKKENEERVAREARSFEQKQRQLERLADELGVELPKS